MLLGFWGQVRNSGADLESGDLTAIVMGGLLADPVTTLPGLFGPNAAFGMQWLQKYPYALPGVLNAIFLTVTAAFVFFNLEEVCSSHHPLKPN